MKLIDLRNIFTNCNDVLIDICGDLIYYAEEKIEDGKQSLFLLRYNSATQKEDLLANYLVQKPGYMMHYFSFPTDFLVVMENGSGEAWVLRLSKEGKEKNFDQVTFAGNYSGSFAIDESHILFYVEENDRDEALFHEYQLHTGNSRAAYLYDLETSRCRSIRDKRICAGAALIPFIGGEIPQLLLLQPHGTEEDKRKCYQDKRWLGDDISDSVWLGMQSEILDAIHYGKSELPMECILRAGTDGLVRYAGQDEKSLYFRALYFPKNDQRLIAVDKETGHKTVAANLTLAGNEKDAQFQIDGECRVFQISHGKDGIHVKGILHSSVDACYNTEMGNFITCLDDRYLLARYEMTDEKSTFVFYSLYDLKTGKTQSYEGDCAVRGDMVVLF
ncbi:hypothetical protein [Caproicibacterium sp. BJN0003]|uniref:hypothetical protein n=1 Tax=Caproicibacterium sp. BJN0003 TaxID=2994078 RepID=UPI00224D6D1E|nr:hypothetical protein [Caproicibacterium sp. BJN0003]UZT82328.1 hypothetical protein OP489_00535 [Caproicibacterium sp. BJN0003]